MPIPFSSVITGFYRGVVYPVTFYGATEPVVTSVSPIVAARNMTLTVVITGTGLTATSAVGFGTGITINSTVVDSATQITINITISYYAVSGLRGIWVRNPSGTGMLSDCFTLLKKLNYVLVQAYNADLTASVVLMNSGAIPLQSDFSSTALWTDSTGAGYGYFSEAPGSKIVYCNGVDTCIWGGGENDCTGCITSTAADTPTDPADYTEIIQNTRQDSENVAQIGGTGGDYWFLRSPVPLQGATFYIPAGEGNDTASVMTAWEWGGTTWDSLTITDNTSISAISLATGGTVTWDSTVATSKQKFIEGGLGYWYQFHISAGSAQIYHCTLDAAFQQIVDIWDGLDNGIAACFKYTTIYENFTVNVYEDVYDSSDTMTYLDLSSMGAYNAGANCVIMGFFDRMEAFNIGVCADKTNSTAATTAALDYWDGADFTTVGTITDGTSEGSISLAKTGTISFSPPSPQLVFKRILSDNALPLYYYRLRFNKALDASTAIYYISGIPAPKQIRGYKFPLYSQSRLMLCGDTDSKKNSILVAAQDTCQVFNGDDSFAEEFGNSEELTCGCEVFAQYGSNLFNITMLFKTREIWGYVHSQTEWIKYPISSSIGCPSPKTLDTIVIPPIEGQQQMNRCLAIWMGSDGVYVSEGRHPMCVSDDIQNLFDQSSSVHINQKYIESFSGFVDKNRVEYHLFVVLTTGDVTALDAEYVLDMKRWKWFKVERGTGNNLQCAINVTDEYGNNHNYGFLDSGYMERLENGNTFDETDIISTLQLGDFPLGENDIMVESSLRAIVPVLAAKTVTTSDITLTHYIDSASTGTDYTIDPTSAGYRLAYPVKAANSVPGILHSIKMTTTIDNETCGFEPLLIGIYYQSVREHDYV